MYIGDYLGRREIYSPDTLAIIDTGKDPEWRLTYRQMNERANRFATWLRDVAGIEKGDRVAIVARDGLEHLDVFFACGKLGAVHTAINWRLHWREIWDIVKQTRPKAIIFSDDFACTIAELERTIRDKPEAIGHYLHIEGDGIECAAPDGNIAQSLHFETTLQASPAETVTCETLDKEDTAALIFTGGTTGMPRAAMVSHRMIAWNTLNTVIHDVTHNDVYLNVFPMFHTGGLFVYTLPQVIFGGTTILLRKFEPAKVLSLIEREKVTFFGGVPTMYQMLAQADNWAEVDLSSLRFCTSGGAPLPVPLVQKYTREKNIRFKQGFGMTEFGPGIFALAPEDAIRKAGSIGRPNFFVDARIVDENNTPLGPNQVGELVLKGPSYCSGYFGDPEATRNAVDDQGWFHTGDLAKHDEEWYFYIVDRKKDMFISGGENVYPVEIERALYEYPGVHMCAVVGIPDPKWGEIGVACVVLAPEQTATEEDILGFLKDRLARYKVPKQAIFMAALPISAAGKILKRELRQQIIDSKN